MSISNRYSGFIRVRVGGIYLEDDKLLLVKLISPISGEDIWTPPGGGVNFKESLEKALTREFLEETSLEVSVEELCFTSELIQGDFHVIEFFFKVTKQKGSVKLGTDPEHSFDEQIISEIGFFSRDEIQKLNVKPEFLRKEFWIRSNQILFSGNR